MKPAVRAVLAFVLFVTVVLVGRRVFSAVPTSISQVGPHAPLIRVEKNENPQNSMVVYTKLDPSCKFAVTDGHPVLDEYWLMDGERYKKVNPLIKNAVRQRFVLDQNAFAKERKFLVHLKDFHELKSDLGSEPTFEVTAHRDGSGCETEVVMQLGPSDHSRKIAIDSIYADSSKKLLPPFRKLNSLTLKGRDVATGEPVERTYTAD
jgi:hypothetical protein